MNVLIGVVAIGLLLTLSAVDAQTPPQGNCTSDPSLLPKLSRNNFDFGIDLYKKVSRSNARGNMVLSPVSIAVALALLQEAARGGTYDQIHDLLIPDIAPEQDLAAFRALLDSLRGDETVRNHRQFRIHAANGLYVDEEVAIEEDFRNLAGDCLKSVVINADFRNNSDHTRKRINDWVAQRTDQKIPDIFQPRSIKSNSRIVLVNAIYLFAEWLNPFITGRVENRRFFPPENPDPNKPGINAPMMTLESTFKFNERPDLQVLGIDYRQRELTMFFIMPKNQLSLNKIESDLGADDMIRLIDGMQDRRLEATVPKFDIGYRLKLDDHLKSVGINQIFGNKADLSRLSDHQGLYVTEALHESYIKVNENGTEPASVTGLTILPPGTPTTQQLRVVIDHPFIFLIRHNPSKTILFIGRVNDPTVKGEQGLNGNSWSPVDVEEFRRKAA